METTMQVPGREGRRLPRKAVRKLVAHQITASIITVATVAVAVGLATVISPDTWLWPAATGGSLRHWIVGIGLGLVGWCVAMDTLEDLDRHVALATSGHLPTAGHSPARTMLLTGFAAVLTWPVWGQIAHAWQVNDLAAAEPVGGELAVRLIPLVVLLLVPAGARAWISEYAEHLWAQHEAHDEYKPSENTDSDTAGYTPGSGANYAASNTGRTNATAGPVAVSPAPEANPATNRATHTDSCRMAGVITPSIIKHHTAPTQRF